MDLQINKSLFLISVIVVLSCNSNKTQNLSSKQIPVTSYWNKPIESFDSSDYVIQLKHMQEFYDQPGEFGHIAEGKDYGFESLSFILTNTKPNGGPPLHVHETEEAHVLHDGNILYTMNGKTFTAKGPYVLRIPAGVPHTFINTGDKALQLTAVFPDKTLTYKELGRNPLVKDSSVYTKRNK